MPNTTKHLLPYPNQTDVADVPTDMRELAEKTEEALNTKWDNQFIEDRFQNQIIVIYGSAANLPATGNDGDVVFLIT